LPNLSELPVTTLLIGAVTLYLAFLNYRLGRSNQALPLHQESHKRRADGLSELCVACQEFRDAAQFRMALLALNVPGHKVYKATERKYLRAMFQLERLYAKLVLILPTPFVEQLSSFKTAVARAVQRAESEGKSGKERKDIDLPQMLKDVSAALTRVYNAARKAIGTEASVAATESLFALQDSDPATKGAKELIRLVRVLASGVRYGSESRAPAPSRPPAKASTV
jgi:hypothetical protein